MPGDRSSAKSSRGWWPTKKLVLALAEHVQVGQNKCMFGQKTSTPLRLMTTVDCSLHVYIVNVVSICICSRARLPASTLENTEGSLCMCHIHSCDRVMLSYAPSSARKK